MARLFFIRIINGKNPFKGDLNHLHHRLSKKNSLIKTNLIIFFLIFIPIFCSYLLKFKLNIFFLSLSVLLYILVIFSTKKIK